MLNVVSLSEAEKIINEKLILQTQTESVLLSDAVGRVLAEDIISTENIPSFNRSTVDGYAVKAEDTYGVGESMPAMLRIKKEILMGETADFLLESGECAKIPTGGMIPTGADSAVMTENTENENDEICLVYKSVAPLENVTMLGDDVKENETVIGKNTVLKPFHIGVLAATGTEKVIVYKRAKVGIVSTGDEIVEISEAPEKGQIRDVNTYLLSAMMKEIGCETVVYGIVKDSFDELSAVVGKASQECDAVLISGGSSAGERDMTAEVISRHGEVFVHGIAMKPGKPTIIGKTGNTAVFGLPGHPAAAYFVALALVRPLMNKLNHTVSEEKTGQFPIKSNISSNNGREEFLCVKITDGHAVPIYGKSGIVSLLSKADGYIRIDRNSEGVKAGETVTVNFLR